MTDWTRRGFLAVAAGGLAACTTAPTPVGGGSAGAQIDTDVDAALAELMQKVPGSDALAAQALGVLVIPNVRQAGFFVGGVYGEGALRINGVTVDYYSVSVAKAGFVFGAQSFNQVLFFLTPEALQEFRIADGWSLGVDAAVVIDTDGAAASLNTGSFNRPIVEIVFGQRGLIADASFAGGKYSRIYR